MHWMLLHDGALFARHLGFVTGRFLIGWMALDWRFYWAIFSGLAHLPAIVRKRRLTRRTMVRSDRELMLHLAKFYRSAPIALRSR